MNTNPPKTEAPETLKPLDRKSEKLEIPAHWKDTTSENSGTKFAIVGAPEAAAGLPVHGREDAHD